MVVKFIADHELCRRLMQIPGVGRGWLRDRERGHAMWRPILVWADIAVLAVGLVDRRAGGGSASRATRT
jgi:hypothetical protein